MVKKKSKVFINCPYDGVYKHLFILIVFYCYYFGFEPVFASQNILLANRLDKIIEMIKECEYGIHDISRVKPINKKDKLPHFNMPFELGMDLMYKTLKKKENNILVLDGEPHQYHKTLSDLNSKDVLPHEDDELKLVNILRKFFTSIKSYKDIPHGINLLDVFIKSFNIWIQDQYKRLGVKDYMALDMDVIKEEVCFFFSEYPAFLAQ